MHFRVTFIISICRCLESFCFCCYLLSLDGTCCCCLSILTVCYYLQPGPLPFAPVFCCLLMYGIICYDLPVLAADCFYLFTAISYNVLLFATICCFYNNFMIFAAFCFAATWCYLLLFAALFFCCCCCC